MSPLTPAEMSLVDKVSNAVTELMQPWRDRNIQWEEDRKLLLMKYRRRIPPFELVLSNDIPVQHSNSVAILAGKPPIFRLPITTQKQEERDKMNRSERLLTGMWREADRRNRVQGRGMLLHEIVFYATLGGLCMFPRVDKLSRRQPTFHVTLYDPINCYPEYGETGLIRFARVYHTTIADARSLAASQGWDVERLKSDTGYIKVVNFWEKDEDDNSPRVYNSVIMGHVPMKAKTEHPEFDSIPIIMQPFNGIPMQPYVNSFEAEAQNSPISTGYVPTRDWGRPVFFMNRELARSLDRNLTYSAEVSRRNALPHYTYLSEDGLQQIAAEDWEKTMILNMKPGEKLEMVTPPTSPREREIIVQVLQEKIAQGGLSRLLAGISDQAISGVALERLINQARSLWQPYLSGVEAAISDAMMMWLSQLARMRFGKLSLESRTGQMGADMGYLTEEFTKEDIPQTPHVEVTLPTNLPSNLLLRLDQYRIAIPGNDPALSERYARENILEVQDESVLEKEIEQDRAKKSPVVAAARDLAGLRRMIGDMEAQPDVYMPEEIDEIRGVLAMAREQLRGLIAPREQPATTMQPSGRQPSPASSPPEERNRASTNAEIEVGQPSSPPRNGSAGKKMAMELLSKARGGA